MVREDVWTSTVRGGGGFWQSWGDRLQPWGLRLVDGVALRGRRGSVGSVDWRRWKMWNIFCWGVRDGHKRGSGDGVYGGFGRRVVYDRWQEGGPTLKPSMWQWESREGGREAVAMQISAEFPSLMSLAVPVVLVNRFSSDYPTLDDFTYYTLLWQFPQAISLSLYIAAWDSMS